MKRSAWVTLALCRAGVGAAGRAARDKKGGGAAAGKPESAAAFHDGMRKLWEDHVTYTRNFIISALAGLEDTPKVTERLLRNQDDIGNAVKPIYGDDAGKKLTAL